MTVKEDIKNNSFFCNCTRVILKAAETASSLWWFERKEIFLP